MNIASADLNLLKYLDMRAEAVEPYRRLGEARHLA